ncbi:hypothetical protein CC1G_07510 [Coprinopsis cinerea okayama7|uniref:Pyrroloquinoline quinone-dependent pyranose dehydrogenase beta-propeller domain-containing protein n=1 Tax=Coprinopsis cinerea (strain Okayama-7 / 130 / ATCC MYA-4618 / FGSC 9003) TaxID=240176 RepID=A8P143_COPC7|nr:hypothetical protein CC1G_07510 [Coprinopsis cinerea okayama7\|eukprot:XP_001838020.2 hypothetical protein CC1G_07510 [Coprinopsis cinerea okayama7\
MHLATSLSLAVILSAVYVTGNPAPVPSTTALCPNAPKPTSALKVAPGFEGTAVVGGISNPRGITLDKRGNILVVERGVGVTGHFVDKNGCVTRSKVIVDDYNLNHGIDISADGRTLFATSREFAWSWDYNARTMTATNRRTLVTGMLTEKQLTRTIIASKVNPNFIAISISAGDGPDYEAFDPAVGRAQVRAFDLTKLPRGGAAYNSSYGRVLGYGLANAVGIAEDHQGFIHAGDNGGTTHRFIGGVGTGVGNDNPAEGVFKLSNPRRPESSFAGYPYCFPVWDSNAIQDRRFERGEWSAILPETEYNDEWCQREAARPSLILPPHSAPLDMKFGPRGDDSLYVAMHSNGYIDPTQGFKVVKISGSYPKAGVSGWTATDASARLNVTFTDILLNDVETEDQCLRGGCFRPLGLVWSQDGDKLYVTSDNTGEIFLLKKKPTQRLWGQWYASARLVDYSMEDRETARRELSANM